jgi:hypothetical protein
MGGTCYQTRDHIIYWLIKVDLDTLWLLHSSSRICKEIRFILGPNNTIKDGVWSILWVIPSGSESGLKIKFE